MESLGRWVSKAEAMREMDISLSTLDRRIRDGEVEAAQQERGVYVLVHGAERPSDRDLLDTAREELAESERAASELRGTVEQLGSDLRDARFRASHAEYRADNLERERSDLRTACREESAARRRMKRAVIALSLIACSLLVLLIF